jgi:protein SCO1/2
MSVQLDEQTDPAEPAADVPTRRPNRQIIGIAVAGVVLLLAGVVASGWNRKEQAWAGTVLPAPQTKPDITLTDTSGAPYRLVDRTAGKFTVLMFGYTNCPDVCPINLATLDSAMESLGPSVRGKVDVVFVTADPQRDTGPVLRSFLDRFDTGFVGLTGSLDQVRAAQKQARLPIATLDKKDSSGDYAVGHATQMIMYGPDGTARIVYPFGTRQSDWTRDLPRLVAGEEPTE